MTETHLSDAGISGDRRVCRVVILHESGDALQRVTALCDHLARRHWPEVDLQFERWSFAELYETEMESGATRAAIEAQIVVVSATAESEFPPEFAHWAENWALRRAGHEGVLVGVLAVEGGGDGTGCVRDVWLHRLALRAGMDYLRQLPGVPSAAIPDGEDGCTARAAVLTGTLSGILSFEPRLHLE